MILLLRRAQAGSNHWPWCTLQRIMLCADLVRHLVADRESLHISLAEQDMHGFRWVCTKL